jgi:hypothetical protein
MRISLTPGQAVTIHGWLYARQALMWADVLCADRDLTFQKLLSYNISEQDLYILQPDLQAWIRAGRATLEDCPKMRAWDAHPIRDFKADLADIVGRRWPHDVLFRMGVDYDELLGLGLTAETMNLFGFTLMMWASLGFRRVHADAMPANTLFRLFGMAKQDVLVSLR